MSGRGNGLPAASLKGVCLDIGGRRILDHITWEAGRGEKWVMLGRNGSGKTSLLKLLSGFGYPSRGRMEVIGERLGRTDLRRLRGRVGWVHGDLAPEIPGFMTALDVAVSGPEGSLVLYARGDAGREEKALEALRSMGAGNLSERRFGALSTGERQRVIIARALAADPELLLLDEPCLGLDPLAREEYLESLSSLLAERPALTVVYVTHHVEEIARGFSRVLVLEEGRAIAQGDRSEVLNARTMTRVFGDRCRLETRGGRLSLTFERG